MKSAKTFRALVVMAALPLSVLGQHVEQAKSDYVYLTGTRFTYPLIEKWITEYKKEYPSARVALLKLGGNTDSANVHIVSHKLDPAQQKESDSNVQVAEYALLPIANGANPLVKKIALTGIDGSRFKELFIREKDDGLLTEEEQAKKQAKNPGLVYTRATASCASISFADHFGYVWEDIGGKGVSGDDKNLLQAVLKDTNGISYNNLGYIYDLKTRLPVKGIAILPIDLNQNGKLDPQEQIYGNLDEVIRYLENNPDEKEIPTAYVNLIFNKVNPNPTLQSFLTWVLTKGQRYNHDVGFFNSTPKALAKQLKSLSNSSN
jgi:phosphate transport system substrate-binding protein